MSEVDTIAKYRVRALLGRGGMGAVYLAHDPELERDVVIKVLRDDEDPGLRERFSREAKAVARLRHPNIVTLHDYGVDGDRQYIVMEYIPGETFNQVIRRRADIPLDRKLELIEGACAGLAHAHAAGIVHRDVKPANLMIDADGTVKVLDFGIARTGAPTLTAEGDLIGTLNYMAPEQLTTGRVDGRTDIFAIGAVLYELIAYEQAFPGDLRDGLSARILQGEPAPLSHYCPEALPGLVRAVEKSLRKQPDDRYQDFATLKSDLAAIRTSLTHGSDSPRAAGVQHDLTLRSGGTTIPAAQLARHRPDHLSWFMTAAVATVLLIAGAMAWTAYSRIDAPLVGPVPPTSIPSPAPAPIPTSLPSLPEPSPSEPSQTQPSEPVADARSSERSVPSSEARDRKRPDTPREAEKGPVQPEGVPPTGPATVEGRARSIESVPFPRSPAREEPQIAPPVERPAVPSTEPRVSSPTDESRLVIEQQIRGIVEAHVKTLASSTQQVEFLTRPVISLAADRRSASAVCTVRFRTTLRPGATFDRKMVFQLRRGDTEWEIESR